MGSALRLLCVLAHPDDEALGMGGLLARYAREGIETFVVTATLGERGRFGTAAERPPLEVVGAARERELRESARVLGVREVSLLGYLDGDLDRADPREATAKIASHLRRVRPQVVVTFGPDGAYGHPDHIAVSQFTTAAIVCAADPSYAPAEAGGAAHRVSKLYYMAWTPSKWEAYRAAFRELRSLVDGVERRASPWPEWEVTTQIDTADDWPVVWRAVSCHETQLGIYGALENLTEEQHRVLWGSQEFYRVFSTVNGGRARETDLFEGLRPLQPEAS